MSHITIGGHKVTGQADYSTTEQFTGQYWIDGKKIYKKVFTGTVTTYTDSSSSRNFSTSYSISNVSEVVSYSGAYELVGGSLNGITYAWSTGGGSLSSEIYYRTSNSTFNMTIRTAVSWNTTSVIPKLTVLFTKTTD